METNQELKEIYTSNYEGLFRYAYAMVYDEVLAEEMVHQVFLKLLEKNGALQIHTSMRSYLYRAVYHECLNHIKHQHIRQEHLQYTWALPDHHHDTPSAGMQYKELQSQLNDAINELPEQCRTVFQMSRFEEMKYAEIAEGLGISIKTVENQMGKALKRLRLRLAAYLPLILLALINLFNIKR